MTQICGCTQNFDQGGIPFLSEAGGSSAGIPQDASAGLERITDGAGNVWAWNTENNPPQWQRLHSIQWGDTLWNLSQTYFGQPSLDGVHLIHDVPQNAAIQGPNPDSGLIPGDVILIPDLQQPAAAPEPVPQTPPEAFPVEPVPGPLTGAVDTSGPPPDWWPPGMPWPPTTTDLGATSPTEPGTGPIAPEPSTVLVTNGTTMPEPPPPPGPEEAPTNGAAKESWWTPGRTAAVAIGAAGGVGLLAFMLARRNKRRRSRR